MPVNVLPMPTDEMPPLGGDTQTPTQQPESTQNSQMHAHLWGFLQPCNPAVARIDFFRVNPVFTIGRTGENSVNLSGMKISARHCELRWDGQDSRNSIVMIQDLSTNGTWINGEKIGRGNHRVLREGNEVAFGTPMASSQPHQDFRYIYRHTANGGCMDGIWAQYDMGSELGRGSFASVMKALSRSTGKWYAVKVIHTNKVLNSHTPGSFNNGNAGSGSRLRKLKREIEIMEKLTHPNICQLKETFIEDASINLVLELVDGGDLLDYIVKYEGLTEDVSRSLTAEICEALAYVHAKGIAHRDLKPENILLTKDDPPHIKVADFGLAKAVDSLTMLRTMCGTPSYLAPEVVLQANYEGYDHLVDSWSVGVIVFSMLTNSSPFLEDERLELRDRIASRTVDWETLKYIGVTSACEDFVRRLLRPDPADRMSLTEARHHRWFRNLGRAPALLAPPPPPAPAPNVNGGGDSQHREPAADSSFSSAGGFDVDVEMIVDDDDDQDDGGVDSMPVDGAPDGAADELGRMHLLQRTPDRRTGIPTSPRSISTTGFMMSHMPGAFPKSQQPRAGGGATGRLQRRSHVIAEAAGAEIALPQPSQNMIAYAAARWDADVPSVPATPAGNKRKQAGGGGGSPQAQSGHVKRPATRVAKPPSTRAAGGTPRTRAQQQAMAIKEEEEEEEEPIATRRVTRSAKARRA